MEEKATYLQNALEELDGGFPFVIKIRGLLNVKCLP